MIPSKIQITQYKDFYFWLKNEKKWIKINYQIVLSKLPVKPVFKFTKFNI